MSNQRSGEDQRPDPEELLDRYQLRDVTPVPPDAPGSAPAARGADSHRTVRGRLRVYLGMAAGVGKTYAMLNEGRRRKARGTDVVVGYVEAHRRLLTEQ